MYELPTSVEVNGKEYSIRNKGDFRVILDCLIALDDAELSQTERVLSSVAIFYADIKSTEDIFIIFNSEDILVSAVKAMYDFFNAGEEIGLQSNIKLVDWEQDEKLICSAINSVSKSEIRMSPYMHWWTFMSYYMSIGDSAFSTVISIRDKIAKGKKLESYEQQFRRDNPQYFKWKKKTLEQKEAEDFIKSVWNK